MHLWLAALGELVSSFSVSSLAAASASSSAAAGAAAGAAEALPSELADVDVAAVSPACRAVPSSPTAPGLLFLSTRYIHLW